MSWMEVAPAAGAGYGAALPAVAMAVNAGNGNMRRRVTVVLRVDQLGNMPWLEPAKAVTVALGTGEHAGKLRITPGGKTPLQRAAKSKNVMFLRSIGLAARLHIPPGAIKPGLVGFDYHDDWIEIDLPKWAVPRLQATVTPAQVAAKPVPFLGAAQREGVAGAPSAGRPVPMGGAR